MACIVLEDIKGKCMLMCPEEERKWREKHGLLHKYETTKLDVIQNRSKNVRAHADVNKVVKQYSRPAAGKKTTTANELRPLPILQKTVQYLIERIMNQNDEKWLDIYEFCSDRLRAVNQDLTMERICDLESAWILESAVRFYLYSDYRLFEETSVLHFDAHINTTLLMECLKRLMVIYGAGTDVPSGGPRADAVVQMAAVYLLFNLDSTDALAYVLTLAKPLRTHPVLSMALRTGLAYLAGNYLAVLRAFRRAPFLLACCLHRHLEHLRRELLMRLCAGFGSRGCRFPSRLLANWLALDNVSQVRHLCGHYGIDLHSDQVCFQKNNFNLSVAQAPRRRDAILDNHLQKVDIVQLISTGQSGPCSAVVSPTIISDT